MRYLVALLLLALSSVCGMLAAAAAITVTERVLHVHPHAAEIFGWLAFVPVTLAGILLARLWVRRTFKRCPACASYVRTEANRCVYCQAAC